MKIQKNYGEDRYYAGPSPPLKVLGFEMSFQGYFYP